MIRLQSDDDIGSLGNSRFWDIEGRGAGRPSNSASRHEPEEPQMIEGGREDHSEGKQKFKWEAHHFLYKAWCSATRDLYL